MIDEALLWLSAAEFSIGVKHRLLKIADADALYRDLSSFRRQIEAEDAGRFEKLRNSIEAFDFGKEIEKLERNGAGFAGIGTENYPPKLGEIDNPPIGLYYKGDVSLLKKPCFALVGTRTPSRYGRDVTKRFAEELSAGFVIVSGMARGIDTEAHRAALAAGGKTVAVVATGLDVCYPPENFDLASEIAKKGLIVSEYPLGRGAQAYYFPERNRIISGVSAGVLATEGGLKSGSLITLNCAVEQNRRAFAVPSNINSKYGAGTNQFLKNLQGAFVTEPADIFKEFGVEAPRPKEKPVPDLAEAVVLRALDEGDRHFEELMDFTGLSYQSLISLLGKMEIKGMIKKLAGNFYGI